MPVIPEMDEFANWDNADPAVGAAGPAIDFSSLQAVDSFDPNHDLDLVLENVDGDDFSYWALEHFEASKPTTSTSPIQDDNVQPFGFEGPRAYHEVPCRNCQEGRYQCKTIEEGKFRGYCTSCVALRCECSFGLASQGPVPAVPAAGFPPNPWPTLGDHPRYIQEDTQPDMLLSGSILDPDVTALGSAAAAVAEPVDKGAGAKTTGPKIGARFSREALKVLKNWLSTHTRHPYPSEEEKEMLQKQTGLNKTQITNWLANARRRNKIVAPRSTSPGVRSFSNPIDIPQRRGTPSPLDSMNPLERWKHSPPEHEPASVTAIARAITSSSTTGSSGLNSPHSLHFTDDGSSRSLCAVSMASSANTSRSSSAFSHGSGRSSLGSFSRGRRRRRRKVATKQLEERNILVTPPKTFQCTFCTETFRTKHDWQRHEKSLHLSLERWVCTPDGPRALNLESNQVSCVFCGEASPNEAHIESHNHSACQERSLDERTFYRKDHLRQHLKLVHTVTFADWSMETWKVATPEIRSRCGFCGIVMDTWTIRVDHLAEHFKTGNTMADWKGDWGFDSPVLDMVENSIPPYLIHDERNSPLPYKATQGHNASPRNCYELLKGELTHHIMSFQEHGRGRPTDDQLQVEACRVLIGAEIFTRRKAFNSVTSFSWLRDLLMSSEQLTKQAQLAPVQHRERDWMSHLQIIGKDNIFEDEPMEKQLHEFVKARSSLGLTALDGELQVEACNILGRLEQLSSTPSDEIFQFLSRLICRSTEWLAAFRQRAHLPRTEEVVNEDIRPIDPAQIDTTIHNEKRLERKLAEYVKFKALAGLVPSDADLQSESRMIIYGADDGWNQTVADNVVWLSHFKLAHMKTAAAGNTLSCHSPNRAVPRNGNASASTSVNHPLGNSPNKAAHLNLGQFYLNDANCYRRLDRELARYVRAAMSPNNPNWHLPSDEELQHQARWIIYDSDDTWNQTPADTPAWLHNFKKGVGLIADVPLPQENAWNSFADDTKTSQSPSSVLPSASLSSFSNMPSASQIPAASSGTELLGMGMDMDIGDTLADFIGDMEFDFGEVGDTLV